MRITEFFLASYTKLLTYSTHVLVVPAKTLHEEARLCSWLRFKRERVQKCGVLTGLLPY